MSSIRIQDLQKIEQCDMVQVRKWQSGDWLRSTQKHQASAFAAAEVPDSTFWVVEMIPGVSEMRDMSAYLRQNRQSLESEHCFLNIVFWPLIAYCTNGFATVLRIH